MRYFFYNVYGDAQELLNTLPSDVTAVPFGWTEEIEELRNKIITDNNLRVTGLPSLNFYVTNKTKILMIDNIPTEIPVENHWAEIRLDLLPKPWSWNEINNYILTF